MDRYLVDFENVANMGLTGIRDLDQDSKVYIFYTANLQKVDMNYLIGIKTVPDFIPTPVGFQSLDRRLISHLGYLLGTSPSDNYIIVSKDQGYNSISRYWNELFDQNNKVQVRETIAILGNAEEYDEVVTNYITEYLQKFGTNGRVHYTLLYGYLMKCAAFWKLTIVAHLKPLEVIKTRYSHLYYVYNDGHTNYVGLKEAKPVVDVTPVKEDKVMDIDTYEANLKSYVSGELVKLGETKDDATKLAGLVVKKTLERNAGKIGAYWALVNQLGKAKGGDYYHAIADKLPIHAELVALRKETA